MPLPKRIVREPFAQPIIHPPAGQQQLLVSPPLTLKQVLTTNNSNNPENALRKVRTSEVKCLGGTITPDLYQNDLRRPPPPPLSPRQISFNSPASSHNSVICHSTPTKYFLILFPFPPTLPFVSSGPLLNWTPFTGR